MIAEPTSFRIDVLLSLQRALWDMVTPALRGVTAKVTYPLIEARFLYEVVGNEERDIAAEVESYVYADFVPAVEVRIEAVSTPPGTARELLDGEEWIYRRRENEE